MREKGEHPSRESNRRDSRAAHGYDEKVSRRKSKIAGSQDERDRDGPLPRHQSMVIRSHERERDRNNIYYQGRSGHTSKLISPEEADKAICALFMRVKETLSFYTAFKEEYQREIRLIEAYAGHTILEKLWERKTRTSDGTNRSGKSHAKKDSDSLCSGFDDISHRLMISLDEAYEGAISHPSSQNESIARKLDIAARDIQRLLSTVRTRVEEMDSLIKELKVLKVVLELGGAGTTPHDDRTSQRPKGHADHGHARDSSPDHDDERYGGVEEDSGGEDREPQDEEHDGHTERFGERDSGGDGEGQGRYPTK